MSAGSLIDDCFLHDKDRLKHEDAIALLRDRLVPVADIETIAISSALRRVLAQDIAAPHNVPLHTNSAVDGYAFAHADLDDTPLPVSSRVAAGDLDPEPLKPGTAARIFTGAPMPPDAETVAMQEDCTERDGAVLIPVALKKGANCRLAGEDLKEGDPVLSTGKRLQASDIAAMASIGLTTIDAYKTLRVICFSSGNEMKRADKTASPLRVGEVFDANWPLLSSLMATMPIDLTDGGVIGDTADEADAAIRKAAAEYDVILTTGGASRGAEDHMLAVLDALGRRHLWQLAVKPGRPMMFGQISRPDKPNDCIFFGLPGNPVAAMVCFLLYTRPALLRLAGANWETPPRFVLAADFEVSSKKPDRREFLRGKLVSGHDGALAVRKFPRDGSGLISSLRESDGLIELPESMTSLKRGEMVDFIPFTSFD